MAWKLDGVALLIGVLPFAIISKLNHLSKLRTVSSSFLGGTFGLRFKPFLYRNAPN